MNLAQLYLKYVSRGPVDIPRLVSCLREERRLAERGIIRVSPALLTEIRSEQRLANRLIKAL